MNGGAKYRKWGGLGWLGGTQVIAMPAHTISYLTIIETNKTMCLSFAVFEI